MTDDLKMLSGLGEYAPKTERLRVLAARDPNNEYLPKTYEACVRDWLQKDMWTVDETASLLAGFRADRPLYLPTPQHEQWDLEIAAIRSEVSGALCVDLPSVGLDPHEFPRVIDGVSVYPQGVVQWARSHDINIPGPLERLAQVAFVDMAHDAVRIESAGIEIPVAERGDSHVPITLSELRALVTYSTPELRALLWALLEVRKANPPGSRDTQAVIRQYIEQNAPELISRRGAAAILSIISTPKAKRGGPKAFKENLVQSYKYRNQVSQD